MVKSYNETIEIDVNSLEELVTDVGTLLVEVKRSLLFKLGKENGKKIYDAIIETANQIK